MDLRRSRRLKGIASNAAKKPAASNTGIAPKQLNKASVRKPVDRQAAAKKGLVTKKRNKKKREKQAAQQKIQAARQREKEELQAIQAKQQDMLAGRRLLESEAMIKQSNELRAREATHVKAEAARKWREYIDGIVPIHFFDFPAEIRNIVYSMLVGYDDSVPSRLMVPAILNYSIATTQELIQQESHISWIFGKLIRNPTLGVEFLNYFYKTTKLYFDFYEMTNPLHKDAWNHDLDRFMFLERTRTAGRKIPGMLQRFHQFELATSHSCLVVEVPSDLFEDVVNEILKPRNGPVTVAMDIGCVLGSDGTAKHTQGKIFDIAGVVAKMMGHPNVRCDLYERPGQTAQGPADVYTSNLAIIKTALLAAGVALEAIRTVK